MVIKLRATLSKDPAAGVKSTKLDVGKLLLSDTVDPAWLQELEPRLSVALRDIFLVMMVEDVFLEVKPGLPSLLTDSTGPAALGNLLDILHISLLAPSLVLVELVLLLE